MSASKNNPHGLSVGQTLYYVPRTYSSQRNNGNRFVTVTSVGRKWAALDGAGFYNLRIDLCTLNADGGEYSSPGRCYLSEDQYQAERALQAEWVRFRNACSIPRSPEGVTVETIKQAAELLGLSGGE